jgi:hypothetical protein
VDDDEDDDEVELEVDEMDQQVHQIILQTQQVEHETHEQ